MKCKDTPDRKVVFRKENNRGVFTIYLYSKK